MTAAAVTAARAVAYRNAGTVEFLVDLSQERTPPVLLPGDEHAAAGRASGDRAASPASTSSGRSCSSRPASRCRGSRGTPAQRGHAIEARVYAEDPARGFLPQAGRLLLYREPERPGVRIDSGVAEGDEVTVHYDPLLAKVIASAETRDLAIARLAAALRQFPVLGVRTNIPFLAAPPRSTRGSGPAMSTRSSWRRSSTMARPEAAAAAVRVVASMRIWPASRGRAIRIDSPGPAGQARWNADDVTRSSARRRIASRPTRRAGARLRRRRAGRPLGVLGRSGVSGSSETARGGPWLDPSRGQSSAADRADARHRAEGARRSRTSASGQDETLDHPRGDEDGTAASCAGRRRSSPRYDAERASSCKPTLASSSFTARTRHEPAASPSSKSVRETACRTRRRACRRPTRLRSSIS